MITLILLLLLAIIVGTLMAQRKFSFIITDANGTFRGIRYGTIVFVIVCLLVIIFQPYSLGKIDAGNQGLLTKLTGDQRGVSTIKEVSGFIIYNSYLEEIQEIPLDQRTVKYEKQSVVAKGGFPCDIQPSFNYSVKRANTGDMFTNLRSSYRNGGLEAVEVGWLETAILGAVTDVSNKWVIDDIFNNRTAFETAIKIETNKRVGQWFTVSQLRTNIQPPNSIVASIKAKAKAVQDAITSESQAKAATADAQRKIALAKGDSATVVIKASSDAMALKLNVEYLKATRWDGVLPTTQLGGNTGTLLNLK
jgi:regulator of protease activity HflC (stomatin/prohibitin superfamily)